MLNIDNGISESNITFIAIQNKSVLVRVCFVLFIVSSISAYTNVYFKTAIIRQNMQIVLLQNNNIYVPEVHCGSAVRFGRALPDFLITAHHLYASLM